MLAEEQVCGSEIAPVYRDVLTRNYPLVERIVQSVSRRHHLKADEAEELGSIVRLKLVENDYGILRKYQGRSSLATYLTTVVTRIYLDWRTAEWGRWRTSAQAKRLGGTAEQLETLTRRDGLTLGEALEVLRTNFRTTATDAELEAMYETFPRRLRLRTVTADALEQIAAPEQAPAGDADDLLERLAHSVAALGSTERRMLKLRFHDGWAINRIAHTLGMPPKAAYRGLSRLLRRLKRSLAEGGPGVTLRRSRSPRQLPQRPLRRC